MKKGADLLFWAIVLVLITGCGSRQPQVTTGAPKVLVFSKTEGYKHESIPNGIALIEDLGRKNGFGVVATKEAGDFTPENLQQYKAVIFNNTTGDVLNPVQQQAFEEYIRQGGGFTGIHAASDTEFDWPWFGQLVGAYFLDHPGMTDTFPGIQQGTLMVQQTSHRATAHLPERWVHTDEFYSFRNIQPGLNVLLTIDEKSYRGGKNGEFHPMTWFREFDGGRSFYTSLGHTKEAYDDANFQKLVLGGIQYAMGAD